MKSQGNDLIALAVIVAPLAGAWIEILLQLLNNVLFVVAPLAGAWIEIVRLWIYL